MVNTNDLGGLERGNITEDGYHHVTLGKLGPGHRPFIVPVLAMGVRETSIAPTQCNLQPTVLRRFSCLKLCILHVSCLIHTN